MEQQQQTPKTEYIDLRALNNAFVHNITSAATKITKRCICIPIDDNFVVESSYVSKRTGKEVRTAIAAVKMWPVTDEDRAAAREKGIENPKDYNLRLDISDKALNALQQRDPASAEGRLYHDFKTYIDPKEYGTYVRSGAYLDVADSGTDDTTLITYDIYRASTTVYNEQTKRFEPLLFALVTDFESNPANTDVMRVHVPMVINRQIPAVQNLWCESNSAGRTFGSDVSKKIRAHVSMFYQSANKESRIITNAPFVNEQIIMPFDWQTRHPALYQKVTHYLSVFKANAHDDVPDVLTGIYEKELSLANDATYSHRRGLRRK